MLAYLVLVALRDVAPVPWWGAMVPLMAVLAEGCACALLRAHWITGRPPVPPSHHSPPHPPSLCSEASPSPAFSLSPSTKLMADS